MGGLVLAFVVGLVGSVAGGDDGRKIFWIHVPKAGGTTLAAVAQTAAQQHGGKVAWCYQRGPVNVDDCSVPVGTLATSQPLQQSRFSDFLPESPAWIASEGSRNEPMMVYGHGVRFGCNTRWKLRGTPLYIIMLRHPLQRLFSAFYQSRRDRNSVNHRKTLDQFVENCAAFPGKLPGGPLEQFLYDKGEASDDKLRGKTQEQRFEYADEVLQRDDVIVLFNEHWDASMELLVAKNVLTSLHGVMSAKMFANGAGGNRKADDDMMGVPYSAIEQLRKCIGLEEYVYNNALMRFSQGYEAALGKPLSGMLAD